MNRQIPLLITASILGLLALSLVQGYLVYNTYQLRKDSLIERITNRASSVKDNSLRMDSVESVWYGNLKELIIATRNEGLFPSEIIPRLRSANALLDEDYADTYHAVLGEVGEGAGLSFQKRLVHLVLTDSLTKDSLLFLGRDPSVFLIGEEMDLTDSYPVGRTTSQVTINLEAGEEGLPHSIGYTVVSDNRVGISDWRRKVLSEMAGLLLLAFSIFGFVFGLLYYSIRSLIHQKKVADIKADFVNNITHEFKTPLATLSVATKMLSLTPQPPASRDTIKVIERQNHRLQKLTDQVLNNAMSYREIRLNKQPVSVSEFLDTLLNDFALGHKEENITLLQRDIASELGVINLDKFYLTSALVNLLDNAVKYNQPPVEVSLQAIQNDGLSLSISDNGIGIARNQQGKVFDKFYRIGNQDVHDVKGLGLGLYYVRQVIQAHGGTIRLESEPSKGTTFYLHIPG